MYKMSVTKIVPEDFMKIMHDFYRDILTTFPEYKNKLGDDIIEFLQNKKEPVDLYYYCVDLYPQRFFDLLYKNENIFENDEMNTKFLPNIEFKKLWVEDISDKTKETIWKYLQLILFNVINEVKTGEGFGDTAKLFEAINEGELKKKLEETIAQMNNLFDMKDISNVDISNANFEDLPNPEDLQSHISGLLDGKLGRLAHEIAEETAQELDINVDDVDNVKDVFQELFKNPGKLMGMVKNVGKKLDEKLKSGEIKESELMQEASELMEKMKSMPGMKNMNSILSQMGLPTGKNSNINMNSFQSHMKQNMKHAKQKERMLQKLEKRRKEREANLEKNKTEFTHTVFSTNEKIEKTSRQDVNNKKKKKKKKKKNKKDKQKR